MVYQSIWVLLWTLVKMLVLNTTDNFSLYSRPLQIMYSLFMYLIYWHISPTANENIQRQLLIVSRRDWWTNSFFCWQNKSFYLFFFFPGADVISFDGSGIISNRFRGKKMKTVRDALSLNFRTTARDGVLLHGEGQQGDYISLELRRATLQLSINLGTFSFYLIRSRNSWSS